MQGGASGRFAHVQYFVDKPYTASIVMVNGMVKGEKYLVEFEANNPKKRIIHTEMPIFLDSEKVDTALGTIVERSAVGNRVKFSFPLGDYFFSHFQEFDEKKFHPRVSEKYLVKYSHDDPNRAIVELSQPRW